MNAPKVNLKRIVTQAPVKKLDAANNLNNALNRQKVGETKASGQPPPNNDFVMRMMEREVTAAENSVVGRRDIFKEKLSTNS